MKEQELLSAWNDLQNRMDQTAALQGHLQIRQDRAEGEKLRKRTLWSPTGDIVLAGLTLLLAGNFLGDHWTKLSETPLAALPAVALAACSVLLIHFAIRQFIASSGLDYSGPILETQARLAELRKLRIRGVQSAVLFWGLGWFLLPVLVLQNLGGVSAGVKLFQALSPAWVAGNVVVAIGLVAALTWAVVKSRFARPVADALVGKDIREAEAFLAEIQEFRKE